MSGRRSRSRSPRRRRSSPDERRRRSDGDGSRYERRRSDRDRDLGRNRTGSSSDQRAHHREVRHKSPERSRDHVDSRGRNPPLPLDKDPKPDNLAKRSGDKTTSRDQENQQTREEAKREEGGARERGSVEAPREKNVLFPSGSNSVNRGRDRLRDRSWREERGRQEGRGQLRGRSEGILARENMEEKGERRLFEALVDPREVPRSGDYFEHDDRDTSQVTSTRAFSDSRRQERRFRSPERWTRGRDRFRPSYRSRDPRDRLGERERSPRRDRGRSPRGDRGWSPRGDRGWSPRGERGRSQRGRLSRDRERRERGGMHSDWSESRKQSRGRDRSPVHWKHDLFETVNQSLEPEEEGQEVQPEESKGAKWRTKSFEEGIEDFNIDDLLSMENPIEKMELEV